MNNSDNKFHGRTDGARSKLCGVMSQFHSLFGAEMYGEDLYDKAEFTIKGSSVHFGRMPRLCKDLLYEAYQKTSHDDTIEFLSDDGHYHKLPYTCGKSEIRLAWKKSDSETPSGGYDKFVEVLSNIYQYIRSKGIESEIQEAWILVSKVMLRVEDEYDEFLNNYQTYLDQKNIDIEDGDDELFTKHIIVDVIPDVVYSYTNELLEKLIEEENILDYLYTKADTLETVKKAVVSGLVGLGGGE